MTDRRSETSRANLGDHIPQALDPDGTVVVSVRLPVPVAQKIDAARQKHQATRSEWIRDAIDRCTEEGTDTWRTIADRKDVEVRVLRGRLDEKDDEIQRLKRELTETRAMVPDREDLEIVCGLAFAHVGLYDEVHYEIISRVSEARYADDHGHEPG